MCSGVSIGDAVESLGIADVPTVRATRESGLTAKDAQEPFLI